MLYRSRRLYNLSKAITNSSAQLNTVRPAIKAFRLVFIIHTTNITSEITVRKQRNTAGGDESSEPRCYNTIPWSATFTLD